MVVVERMAWSTFHNEFHFVLQDGVIDIAIARHRDSGQMPWILSIRKEPAMDYRLILLHHFRHHRGARHDRFDKKRAGLQKES